MKKVISIALLPLFFLTGCQTSNKAATPEKTTRFTTSQSININSTKDVESSYSLITQDPWNFIQNQLVINIPENQRIITEKKIILKSINSFQSNILRAEPYIYYIINQLNERNMPVELALVPLIESAYNPLATSYAKATGLWQIVPITAKEYGLKQSSSYDPRRDLMQSTNTAINLLQSLNQRFDGDWLLTLAAYNAGEGRVRKAMEWNKVQGLPTNYWALNLPKETMRYIPKFLAIIDLIKNNNQYSISLPTCTYSNSLVRVDLSQQISLEKIAQYAGISLDELLEFNAGYLKKIVRGPYHLLIPSSYAENLYAKLQKSNLVDSEIIDLLQVKIVPLENPNVTNFGATFTNKKYIKISDADLQFYEKEHNRFSQIIYRVKSGDNLYTIAKNHKVSINDILKWNKNIKPKKLKPGDKLTIHVKNYINVYNSKIH